METIIPKNKGGRKPKQLTPIELESVPVPEGQAWHEEEVKVDPEDSWILCTNGTKNKLFPPALVNSKEFTKITKYTPVEINKL